MNNQRLREIRKQLYGCAKLTPAPDGLGGLARWILDLEQQAETAESVAQMAAHDRDEALQQAADCEQQCQRLLRLAATRLAICLGRMRACHEETGNHELLAEVEMFAQEAKEWT